MLKTEEKYSFKFLNTYYKLQHSFMFFETRLDLGHVSVTVYDHQCIVRVMPRHARGWVTTRGNSLAEMIKIYGDNI